MTQPIARIIFALWSLCSASCDWGAQIRQLKDDNEELNRAVQALEKRVDVSLVRAHCKNPKILNFLRDCQQLLRSGAGGEQCSQLNVDQVMKFMRDEPHVVIRMWPRQKTDYMQSNRESQVAALLSEEQIKSVSSVLLIVQPQSEKPKDLTDALRRGRRLKQKLLTQYPVREDIVFGPLPITCRGKSRMLDWYARYKPDDRPYNEEPQERDDQIVIWVFRLDCGHVAPPSVDRVDRGTAH